MSILVPEGKAITRSIRIDKTWDKTLEEIADKKNMSKSALIEKICVDYILFHQWVEEFDSIVFHPDTIIPVFEALDEDTLKKIAHSVAKNTFKNQFRARGAALDLGTVMFQISDQMAKYANWFSVVEHKGDTHYFYIRQRHGEKWACFVETFLCTLFREVAGIEVISERNMDNILIKLEK